ncbi:hypothetical protein [Streptomyces sp. ALB3]|uniref:hypothetical protein n=1 Tax=Streptomyces sp. ALB3 TaxID=3374278 RepID=UPI00379B3CF6
MAELLGLNEREVRIARRTVGKSDARSLAGALLDHQPAGPPDSGAAPEDTSEDSAPSPPPRSARPAVAARPEPAQPSIPSPRAGTFPAQQVSSAGTTGAREWSHAHDTLLVEGWTKGTDAVTLAAQLGVGLPQLVSRAQLLYANGRFAQVRLDRGRHRRVTHEFPRPVEAPSHGFGRAVYASAGTGEAWSPSSGTSGEGETPPYAPYGQDMSGLAPSHVDAAAGNHGYQGQQRWPQDAQA